MAILAVQNLGASSVSFLSTFKTQVYGQTADAAASPTGYFFAANVYTNVASPYITLDMLYPGPGSPVSLMPQTPTHYNYATGYYPTLAAMDADFPFGTYAFNGDTGSGAEASSYDYLEDNYSASVPFLAGTSFSSLQGMNAGQAINLSLSPFVMGSGTSTPILFFTIYDRTTNMLVFDAGFLPSTTSSILVPANTLAPGHSFTFDLVFSQRVLIPSVNTDFDAELGFDRRTLGDFTTSAVPEPSTMSASVFALLALTVRLRRRSRNS